ncbi:unnamed protein product [Rotaria sp. Silwood2]|nr:unnamed protein product [Rotaria sp. Silwood2]
MDTLWICKAANKHHCQEWHKLLDPVQGKNVLFETEIKTYLNDHGSLINENELAKEVSKKLKNIIKCRRTIEKRREKRRQSKTTTIELRSNIDSNNSDNNDDPPVSLTSTTTMLPSIDRRKLDNDDGQPLNLSKK